MSDDSEPARDFTVVGIDAATQPKKVGLARGRIERGRLVVERVVRGTEVESMASEVASWISGPTVIAVDAPLGWPSSLGPALIDHEAGARIGVGADDMFNRLTDRLVHDVLGHRPLEVGADRIARTALAALELLEDIRREADLPIPVGWVPGAASVQAIEVYPAATLKSRGIDFDDYKKSGGGGWRARKGVLGALLEEIDLREETSVVLETDHALDSVVCLLAAADFVANRVVPPPTAATGQTRREGWIWFRPPGSWVRR